MTDCKKEDARRKRAELIRSLGLTAQYQRSHTATGVLRREEVGDVGRKGKPKVSLEELASDPRKRNLLKKRKPP